MKMRSEGAKRVRAYGDLAELIEMVNTNAPRSPAVSVIVGRITNVSKLASYAPSSLDETATRELSYDDPRGQWRAVRLDVEVDETVAGKELKSANVGLVVDPSLTFDAVRMALLSYGDVVLPLVAGSPVFASHPELFAIVDDGELLMDLRGDQLVLPFIEPSEAETLLASLTKLSSLRLAAR